MNYSNFRWASLGFVAVVLAACSSGAPATTSDAESLAFADSREVQLIPKVGGGGCTGSGAVSANCDIQYNANCKAQFSAEVKCQF